VQRPLFGYHPGSGYSVSALSLVTGGRGQDAGHTRIAGLLGQHGTKE